MEYFKYGKKEIEHLKKNDLKLEKVINNLGYIKREVNRDLFSALISSIISQQISIKAAQTVTGRLENLIGKFTVESIKNANIDEIQKCGMSYRKADYIKGISKAYVEKEVDFKNIYNLSDDLAIKELTKLKGVGEWTAEMLLIHSLERKNILSFKDLGIRRGIMKLYDLDSLTKKEFEEYKDIYSPYATVASIYLWEI